MMELLWVLYFPGIPEVFKKKLQVQVAFLLPQEITLTGVAVFPRLSLNLPQNLRMHSHSYSKHILHVNTYHTSLQPCYWAS